ncbi:MAG: type II toxin-antitoxin system RelE/ParE family toxin [Acidobacteriaceae bacterium]|nr:type II toxin-antitoxin system RelE/ParE family toxin [Acidobacteriaceae bacterium]
MFRVVVAPRAWRDFFEIFDYISLDNPHAAAAFCRALLSHLELLSSFRILARRPQTYLACGRCCIRQLGSITGSMRRNGQ